MKKTRMKYFSFDKMDYLNEMMEGTTFPVADDILLDPELKIAG